MSDIEKQALNLSFKENELIKPYYNNAGLVHRYYTNPQHKYWIIYTDSNFKEPSRMNSYPNLKAHLDKFAGIITSDNKPYGLHRAREERFFKGEKVIALRKCVGRPLFSYSDFDCYLSATFYIIKTNRVDMKYLTGLLNSKLIKFWLKNRGKMQGNNYQLDKEPLVAIPIAVPALGLQQPIINLVDRIIVAHRDNKTEDIASIEAQINSHIYRLYNINDDEKVIIDPEGQKPASEETITRICGNMDKNFSLLLPVLCDSVYTLENLNQIDSSQIIGNRELTIFNLWKMLMQLQVFNLVANLDLTVFLRSNYRAGSNPEKRFNLKYIIIMTFEVYKYLFGYKDDAPNGKLELLKTLANQLGDSELTSDIDSFEQYADEIGRLSLDRIARNTLVHYDQDPLKVYNNLEAVNEKKEVDRLCVALGMIEGLLIIVKKYAQKYQLPLTPANDYFNLSAKETINTFHDKDNKLYNQLNDFIDSFSKRLDSIVHSCRQPAVIAEKLNLDKTVMNNIKFCIDSINPCIHIHVIYLDLASAIRAYLSAEYYYEKQVNLRRINIIVYEGFKHIYGYNEKDLSLSFWQKQIFLILKSTKDIKINELLLEVENELKTFAANITIIDVKRRELSIHYRFENRDNALSLFHNIIESNSVVELQRALALVNLSNKLIKLNTAAMSTMQDIQNAKSRKSTDDTIGKLNDIVSQIDMRYASDEQKLSIKENTEKIRNLLSTFKS